MKVLNYSLLFMFIMLVVACSESEQTPEQDPPEIIDINNLIDPSIDPESGGDILDITYKIDLNEDGITDYILEGMHGGGHHGIFHSIVLLSENDGAYLLKENEYDIGYQSIDTVITQDSLTPYLRIAITETNSCRPIDSPNATMNTIQSGDWEWEPDFNYPDPDDNRWQNQNGSLLFKAAKPCDPTMDLPYIGGDFIRTCFTVIYDCHGLFDTEQAYFYLKVVADGRVTLGYFKSEQSSDGSHGFIKLVRLPD